MTSKMTNGDLLTRTEAAVAELTTAGKPVTFTAVAAATGVSRATLYRHPELRAVIDHHRTQPTASVLAVELHQLRIPWKRWRPRPDVRRSGSAGSNGAAPSSSPDRRCGT
jgi:Family of unknown function (DUF6262)